MMYPKITVVTVSLNSEDYIDECIQSVLNQAYPNLEYIIVDGASTDKTCAIIEKYKKHLSCFISEPDSGAAEAINKGFSKSTGDILCWLNSDDKFHQGCLFAVAEIFKSFPAVEWIMGYPTWYSQIGVCVGDMSYEYTKFYQSPQYINDSMHLKFARWSKWRFAMGDFSAIQQESVFWRRALWEKTGGVLAEDLIAYDLELWTRFFEFAELNTVNILLSGFRVHGKQVSSLQKIRYMRESDVLINKFVEKMTGRSEINQLRTKLARLFRLFYYYDIPILEKIFPSLLKLPAVIEYNVNSAKFEQKQ